MVDRNIAPEYIAPKKFNLPQPGKISFDNGSQFYFLEVGDQPIVKLEFIFRAGTWFETNPGVAFFTAKMLMEGTTSFSSKDISEKFDSYGAFIEISPGFDYINISIHIPTRHFNKIESILAELLFEPSFPEHEFEILKYNQIQQLKVNEQKNNFVASRLFRKELFGDSPYGHVMTEDSINEFSVQDLKTHFDHWMNGKFDIFLTGKFDAGLPEKISQLVYSKLKAIKAIKDIDFSNQLHFDLNVEKKESLQSSIFMGRKSINKTHNDFPALLLLNEVFGGYFGSRLMQNIREDKGYTYSIYSHLATLKNDAYFVINSEVKKDNKDEAIEEIKVEIEKIKQDLISKEELYQVKNYLKGSLINSLTSTFSITEKLKNIIFYDLDMDFYENLFDQVDDTSENDLILLANNLLFDRPLSSVIVG